MLRVTARLPPVLRPFTDNMKTEEEPPRLGVGGKETELHPSGLPRRDIADTGRVAAGYKAHYGQMCRIHCLAFAVILESRCCSSEDTRLHMKWHALVTDSGTMFAEKEGSIMKRKANKVAILARPQPSARTKGL